ncbi:MAG TPA: non-canonical purine NTP pyrophosphatase [Candidatus Binatia bacterium]|nr:non-canonical purine NTP pyrophosphatase [Candidatus Binatia bacterium]
MIPARLVVASWNPGKVAELVALVREWGGVECVPLAAVPGAPRVPEGGGTYGENAIAKARAAARASGLPALADDSGLEVDALGGAPGVRSARWAGDDASDADRNARLLAALADVPDARRTARFRCVVALAWPDGRVETAEGVCEGRIARAPRGARGFGYDPVFVADDLGVTFAEVPAGEKRRVDFRARAMRALGAALRRRALRVPAGPC